MVFLALFCYSKKLPVSLASFNYSIKTSLKGFVVFVFREIKNDCETSIHMIIS